MVGWWGVIKVLVGSGGGCEWGRRWFGISGVSGVCGMWECGGGATTTTTTTRAARRAGQKFGGPRCGRLVGGRQLGLAWHCPSVRPSLPRFGGGPRCGWLVGWGQQLGLALSICSSRGSVVRSVGDGDVDILTWPSIPPKVSSIRPSVSRFGGGPRCGRLVAS